MRALSDYKDEEAIELWADLLDPLTVILSDAEFTAGLKGKAHLAIAKEVLKKYKKETIEILERIDPEPIDGMNVLIRFVGILADIGKNQEIMGFFGSAVQEASESESSGLLMESTEEGEE